MSQKFETSEIQIQLERLREIGYEWDLAAKNLKANGFEERAIADVLRTMDAWSALALRFKAKGQPYEEIAFQLQEVHAEWADVASALMAAGLSGADMLRILLPLADEDRSLWGILQIAVCHSPEASDFKEIRAVIKHFGIDPEEFISHVAGPVGARDEARRRLGLQ